MKAKRRSVIILVKVFKSLFHYKVIEIIITIISYFYYFHYNKQSQHNIIWKKKCVYVWGEAREK